MIDSYYIEFKRFDSQDIVRHVGEGNQAVEQNIDERSGDQHDGRHGGDGRG